MKKCFPPQIFFLILLFSFPVLSQNSVKGSIVDQNYSPVPFANVILLQASDSTTVYKGTVSEEDGSFLIENVKNDAYVLEVRFVGFENYLKSIEVKGNTNLKQLVLAEMAAGLDEVTIKAKKPTISKSIDRLTFNVENSILSSGNSYEILKRTPGVIVSQGQLLIKNRPAVVYINDKKVYLTSQELQQLLEGFSGENVKSVEVITNPPAKYDAEGGAILNIITTKNLSVGYKGSVNGSNTVAIVPKYTIGTSQYYKTDWLNAYASYNYNSRFDYKEDKGEIVFYEPNGTVNSRWNDLFKKDSHKESHSISSIFDITLNDNNKLSLSSNLQLIPEANSDISGRTQIFNSQRQLDSLYTTDSRLENEQNKLMLNATYTSKFGDNSSLVFQGNYIKYNDDQTQDLMTEYFSANGDLLRDNSFYTFGMQETDIYTSQLDLSSNIGEMIFEGGLKYAGIDSGSGLEFFNTNSGSKEFVSALSDDFNYKESIYAGYLSFAREWDKWSIKAGLRGEYTDIAGNSNSLGVVNSQEYFNVFPTFYLMRTVGEDHSLSIDYSRRIGRPRFQSLNPFKYFLNENNFNLGNPNLKPSISNKIALNYTFKNKLSFDLYWDKVDNSIATLPYQNNESRVLRSVTNNLIYDEQYSFDVSYFDYLTDWWGMYLYTSVFYLENEFIALESNNVRVNNEVTSVYLMANNNFTLSKDGTFTGEIVTYYMPTYMTGSYEFSEPQYSLSFGVRKTFFDDRLSATINVEDVLNTTNVEMESRYLNQNYSFLAKPESRNIRFGLVYKFGNFKLRDNQRSVGTDEKERLEKS